MSFALVLLILCSACDRIFPYTATPPTSFPYRSTVQIYRALPDGNEFTEDIELVYWCEANKADPEAQLKISKYTDRYMAPGFVWNYRDFQYAQLDASIKPDATDCDMSWNNMPMVKPTYGAPHGAVLRWESPPPLNAYATFWATDKDGEKISTATEVQIRKGIVNFAERTGLPDQNNNYVIGKRHIRFSDIFIELKTPFQLVTEGKDPVTVMKFYVQSIGTVIAEGGDPDVNYTIGLGQSKYFVYVESVVGGETRIDSFCIVPDSIYSLQEYQGAPYMYFTFQFEMTANIGYGPIHLKLQMSKPAAEYGQPGSFDETQPFVQLKDMIVESDSSPVELKPEAAFCWFPTTLTKYLWFENFESQSPAEKFLGEGETLSNLKFSKGDHKITLVVYNSYGAYNSDTMLLQVSPPHASDDGPYSVDEDSTLTVPAPGVLGNDTPAGELTAKKVADPEHGSLTLSANGSFTYKPNTDWSGTDSFTYKANNGLSDSNVATVTIIVNNLTPDQEIKKELEEMVKALVTAGALNAGQGNSLIAKCEVGIAKIKAGQKNNGCALLLSFINEVQSLIDNGDLKEEQGQPLIDKARNIMGELGCTS